MNRKKSLDLNNVCRTCMKQFLKTRMRSILEVAVGCKRHATIMELLQRVQPDIEVAIEDNLPMKMCNYCIQKLLSTYEFIEMYKESDKNLRKALKESQVAACSTAEQDLTEDSFCTYDIYGTNKYSLEIEQLNNRVKNKEHEIKIDWPVLEEPRNIEKSYLTSVYSDDSEDEWKSWKHLEFDRVPTSEHIDFNETSNDSMTDNDHNETISLNYSEINDDLEKTDNYEKNVINIDNDETSDVPKTNLQHNEYVKRSDHKNNNVKMKRIRNTKKKLQHKDDAEISDKAKAIKKQNKVASNDDVAKIILQSNKAASNDIKTSDQNVNANMITKERKETNKRVNSPITTANLKTKRISSPVTETNLPHSDDDDEITDIVNAILQDNEVVSDDKTNSNKDIKTPEQNTETQNITKERNETIKTNLQHNELSIDDSDNENISIQKMAIESGNNIGNQTGKQQNRLEIPKNKDEPAEQEPFVRNEDGTIQCNNCKIILDNLELWIEHMSTQHIEKNKKTHYECEHCGKVFTKKSNYKVHLRVHSDEKRHLCFECGKSFKSFGSFNIHMKRHKGEKDFQCSQCPKKFVCSSGLYNHMMVHTKEKPFVCDICGSAFHMAIHLRKHKLYHDGVKNFPCEYCDKRFVLAEKQRRHMRSHTGEKPYRCKYCPKAFSQSNDHIKHLRTHIGNNVYQCKLCPLRFPMARDLQIHFATHKDDDDETRARNLEARAEEERKLEMKLKASN